MLERIQRALPEGWQWWIATATGAGTLYVVMPGQLELLLWVVTKLSAGSVAGYLLDRTLFPWARLDDVAGDPVEARHVRYRRAGLIAAGGLAVTIGL